MRVGVMVARVYGEFRSGESRPAIRGLRAEAGACGHVTTWKLSVEEKSDASPPQDSECRAATTGTAGGEGRAVWGNGGRVAPPALRLGW